MGRCRAVVVFESSRRRMAKAENATTASVLKGQKRELLAEWVAELGASRAASESRISEQELRTQAETLLSLLQDAAQSGDGDLAAPQWTPVRDFLEEITRSRVTQGFSAEQTAHFIFSLKKPLF